MAGTGKLADENSISSRVDRIEGQLGSTNRVLLVLIGFLFVLALALDISAQLRIPAFCRMFDEMLPGEPLPALTVLVIKGRLLSLVIDAVLLAVLIVLLVGRKIPLLVPVAAALTVVVLAKAMLTGFALTLPLLNLLTKLAG